MEKQIEFGFVKDMMKLDGKECRNCKHADGDSGVCKLDYSEISGDHSCGFWEQDTDSGMKEISMDVKKKFHELMDKYKVTPEDREEIFVCCHWF